LTNVTYSFRRSRRLSGAGFPFIPKYKTRPVLCAMRSEILEFCQMPHRRRRVYIETSRGRISAGFSVSEDADAADVSIMLRHRGWQPYRIRFERERQVWVASVIDWRRRAA
jgi:hypothetical protein